MPSNNLGDLSTQVKVLQTVVESGQRETGRRLDKIENKLDAQQNVSVAVFEELKKDVREGYVTKESHSAATKRISFLEKVVFSFIGLVLVIVLGAIINGAITP